MAKRTIQPEENEDADLINAPIGGHLVEDDPIFDKIEQIEDKEIDNTVSLQMNEGEMGKVADFFEQLDVFAVPHNEYDVVIYKLREGNRGAVGTAASKAITALKPNGLFIVDYSGFVTNMAEIKLIVEFCGLVYKDQDYKNGVVVFRKPLAGETHEIKIDMVEK